MKLVKRLIFNGDPIPLVSEDVRLNLNTPGRAFFIVSQPVKRGIIALDIGYQNKLSRYFYGYVESVTQIDSGYYSLFCQEFGAALNRRITTNLRHVTLKGVIKALSKQTALQFIVPEQPYADTLAACFYSIGGGYHCIDSLADIFSIPRFTWQQQTDGKLFVGSWDDSRWKSRRINITHKWLNQHGVNQSATLPTVPALRPGVFINERGLVTKIQFKNDLMQLTWSKEFWKKPLKSW